MMKSDELKQAAVAGNVDVLKSLIRDDNLILGRVSLLTRCNETPLHIAAIRGHLEFVSALVVAKPKLASVCDIYGLSPLHMASAEGHVEIVKVLVRANSQVCLNRDQKGRTPLQLAAINEQVEVVQTLIEMAPELARKSMLDYGDTVLHLCVKNRCLKSLKLLVEWNWGGEEDIIVNAKDDDGNTILHLAAMLKDVETAEYLLSRNGIKTNANAKNDNELTALDISEQCSSDFKSRKIRKLLREVAGLTQRADDIVQNSLPPSSSIILPVTTEDQSNISHNNRARKILLMLWDGYIKSDSSWLEDARGNLMVAATVTATMAFQAGLNPPGGVWQEFGVFKDPEFEETDVHMIPGYSIAATRLHEEYTDFMNYNTASLVASLSTILLMISGFPLKSRIYLWLLMLTMCFTVVFILKTYLISLYLISANNDSWDTTENATKVSLRIWIGLCVVVILLHTLRFFVWVVKKWRARHYYRMRLDSS